MAGPGTTFEGPIQSGTIKYPTAASAANVGLAMLTQTVTLTENGATAVTAEVMLPYGSQIVDFHFDVTTAWNSGSSDTLSVGVAAAGTDYVSGVSTATAGRIAPTYTAAQLSAMANIGANTGVFITVTPVGTTATTGAVTVTVLYVQTVQLSQGAA